MAPEEFNSLNPKTSFRDTADWNARRLLSSASGVHGHIGGLTKGWRHRRLSVSICCVIHQIS